MFGDTEQLLVAQTLHRQHLADQGRHRLQAARHRVPPDARLQLQPHRGRGGALPVRRPAPRARRATTTSASRRPSSTTTSATSRSATTSTRCASASSRSRPTSAASCSRTTSSACACSATATTTAGSTTSPGSGASRRTPTAASTTSGEDLRDDDVFVANLYRQDFPVLGLTSQATVVHNRNRDDASDRRERLPARARPCSASRELREYDVIYLGFNGDGRIGRLNLTASGYYALGEDENSLLDRRATPTSARFFLAAEPSIDFDWIRFRLSALYASGDDDPFDDDERRLRRDLREPDLRRRRHQLLDPPGHPVRRRRRRRRSTAATASCRRCARRRSRASRTSSIPGLILLGVGADFDVLPELRLSVNANYLWFDDTAVLEALRKQARHPQRDRLGPVGRGDLAAVPQPERRPAAVRRRR